MTMTINRELQAHLDGEIGRDALSPALRAEADRLNAAFDSVRQEPVRAPSWLENRIMVSLPTAPRAPWHQRVLSAALRPRTVRIRPITVGFASAFAALALVLLNARAPHATELRTPVVTAQSPVVYVQFVFAAAESARTVSVAGDFNGWQPDAIEMRDPDGDGVWTALVGVQPGVHKYMFVVDGEHWVTDPNAERHIDDGFGHRNAVLSIAAHTSS